MPRFLASLQQQS